MAVSVSKTFVAGEILTASDLNGIETNLISNGEDLAWPASKAKDFNQQAIQLDDDKDTTIQASTDDRIDFTLGNVVLFAMDGTTASSINGFNLVGTIAGTAPTITVRSVSDTNVNLDIIPLGTGVLTVNGDEVATILAAQVYG